MTKKNQAAAPPESAAAVDNPSFRADLEAQAVTAPHMRHAIARKPFVQAATGFENLDWAALTTTSIDECKRTAEGDLRSASHMLTAQALTLDAVFTDLLQRSSLNSRDYPHAAERYMRLALKAQAHSRATIEALAKLHQPREQTVKHVHIDNRGGQAMVAETIHTGGSKPNYAEQSYGQHSNRAGSPALPGEDTSWHGVPVPGNEGAKAVQDSRGQGRRADREPGCVEARPAVEEDR